MKIDIDEAAVRRMPVFMTSSDLIERPAPNLASVVILGAGASKAALPDGDPNGLSLPVMKDLITVIGLNDVLNEDLISSPADGNFEAIYGSIASDPRKGALTAEIEGRIHSYFSEICLPEKATIYDAMVLSLKEGDTIISFNWDPLLVDALQRNSNCRPVPECIFLHGNVRYRTCAHCCASGLLGESCATCGRNTSPEKLLYPVESKDYSKAHLKNRWECAIAALERSFSLTIFGYGAPVSDSDAVALLRNAWFERSNRRMEHVEVIDIARKDEVREKWRSFTPTDHLNVVSSFRDSRLFSWPRRSGEAIYFPMTQGVPCERFPFKAEATIDELRDHVEPMIAAELRQMRDGV